MGKAGGGGGKIWSAVHTGLEGARGGGKDGALKGIRATGAAGRGGGGGILFLLESEVLEEREVEEEDMDTDESKDDFLSGTLGLGLLPDGDLHLIKEGTGVPAVGVLD